MEALSKGLDRRKVQELADVRSLLLLSVVTTWLTLAILQRCGLKRFSEDEKTLRSLVFKAAPDILFS